MVNKVQKHRKEILTRKGSGKALWKVSFALGLQVEKGSGKKESQGKEELDKKGGSLDTSQLITVGSRWVRAWEETCRGKLDSEGR
jgi:hypothetical protein